MMMMGRANKQKEMKTKEAWNHFLQGIGGAQSLSFGWTRQSGQRWGIGVFGQSRKRWQLRSLVREGVSDWLMMIVK